jgi:hypothetical protein
MVGAAALLLVSAAPVVAQDEATTDGTTDVTAAGTEVGPLPEAAADEAAPEDEEAASE